MASFEKTIEKIIDRFIQKLIDEIELKIKKYDGDWRHKGLGGYTDGYIDGMKAVVKMLKKVMETK